MVDEDMVESPRKANLAASALAASFVMVLVLGACSFQASAGIGPLPVSGYVKDSAGRAMEGVPVVVVVKNGGTTVGTLSTTTDPDGFYTVTFDRESWDLGYTLISTATWGGDQVSESITITQEWGETIDLQFPFEIPQFGSVLGFLAVAAAVGVVAFLLLPRKSKAKKQ